MSPQQQKAMRAGKRVRVHYLSALKGKGFLFGLIIIFYTRFVFFSKHVFLKILSGISCIINVLRASDQYAHIWVHSHILPIFRKEIHFLGGKRKIRKLCT